MSQDSRSRSLRALHTGTSCVRRSCQCRFFPRQLMACACVTAHCRCSKCTRLCLQCRRVRHSVSYPVQRRHLQRWTEKAASLCPLSQWHDVRWQDGSNSTLCMW